MKILIDLSGCDMIYFSATVYAIRNLKGFRDNGYKNISILCNSNIYEVISSEFPDYQVKSIELSRSLSPLSVIKGYFNWRKIVKSIEYDAIYSPFPYPPFYCVYNKGKIVTTFLDLQGLKLYSGLKLLVNKIVFPFVLKRSDKIITISDYVKDDILATYSFVKKKKINTVYPSVISHLDKGTENPINGDYILYVSSFMKHKNVMTLLKAYNIIKSQINQKLVLIGKKNEVWESEVEPFINENSLNDRVIRVSGLSDQQLDSYYSHASLLVHPSLMEGFGYTPIEAAFHGVPVVSSKETALFETTMGLLNYYEPATDEKALSEAILSVLGEKTTDEKLSVIADKLKEQYDYKKIAAELYNEIIN